MPHTPSKNGTTTHTKTPAAKQGAGQTAAPEARALLNTPKKSRWPGAKTPAARQEAGQTAAPEARALLNAPKKSRRPGAKAPAARQEAGQTAAPEARALLNAPKKSRWLLAKTPAAKRKTKQAASPEARALLKTLKKSRRHPAKTRTARSAKNRLLHSAIRLFASHGFDGASTRLLSDDADVNISAIPYYFNDKAGLYRAVLDFIAAKAHAELSGKASLAHDLLRDETASPAACRDALHGLFSVFIRFLLSEEISPSLGRIFMREQMEPSPAFTVFYETTMRPMHETLTHLVARAANLPFPSEAATLAAHAMIGTVSVFKTHRELALRRLKWKKYGQQEIQKISDVVWSHAEAVIDAYLKNRGGKL